MQAEPGEAELILELGEIVLQAVDLALVEVQVVLGGRFVVDPLLDLLLRLFGTA